MSILPNTYSRHMYSKILWTYFMYIRTYMHTYMQEINYFRTAIHHFFYDTNVSIDYHVFSCAASGAFNISNVTFVSSRVANITLKKVSTYILLVLLCNYYTVRDSAGDK